MTTSNRSVAMFLRILLLRASLLLILCLAPPDRGLAAEGVDSGAIESAQPAKSLLVVESTGREAGVASRSQAVMAVVGVDVARVRDAPSLTARIVRRLPQGCEVSVLGEDQGWYQIALADGRTGWASRELFTAAVPAEAAPDSVSVADEVPAIRAESEPVPEPTAAATAVVGVDVARVRDAPSLTARIVRRLTQGSEVSVLGEDQGWYRIALADGRTGWASRELFVTDGRDSCLVASGSPSGADRSQEQETVQKPLIRGKDFFSWPGTIRFSPELVVRWSYDDNLFFEEVADVEQLVAPRLSLNARRDQLEFQADAWLDVFNYRDATDFNRINQSYALSLDYEATSRMHLGLAGGFILDHSLESELKESGLVVDKDRHQRVNLDPTLRYAFDERTHLDAVAHYMTNDYDQNTETDSVLLGAGMTVSRILRNQRTRLLGSLDVQRVAYEPEGGDGVQWTTQAMAGMAHAFSPDKDVVFRGGLSYTDSSFEFGDSEVDSSDMGFVFDASVHWKWELTDMTLGASRVVTASSLGENVTRDRLLLSIDHRLSERWSFFSGLSAYQTVTDGLTTDEERRTLIFNPGFRYRLTEDADLRLGYEYSSTERLDMDDFQSRNRVFGQIDVRFPLEY